MLWMYSFSKLIYIYMPAPISLHLYKTKKNLINTKKPNELQPSFPFLKTEPESVSEILCISYMFKICIMTIVNDQEDPS
jgi:hypothetical protein